MSSARTPSDAISSRRVRRAPPDRVPGMSPPTSAPLARERTGRGTPLVLLHPLGADRHVWDALIPHLRDRRELIAVDLPGFGDSPPWRGLAPEPAALAASVAQHLASIGLDRPH